MIAKYNKSTLDNIPVLIASAALATINSLAKELEMPEFQKETLMWEIIQSLISDKKDTQTKVLKSRNLLFPTQHNATLTVTPEIMQLIQKEAANMLETFQDATDHEKAYWKSLKKGKIPKWIEIES